MSKIISLTKGYSTIVDDEDYDWLMQWDWHISTSGTWSGLYARRSSEVNRKTLLMHREIMGLASPPPFIDHINRNGLDNRRSNLRICTNSQNQANKPLRKNSSGYKGVTYFKQTHKWRAEIQFEGRKISLGYFKEPIDAAMAYDVAALRLFGEFAVINGARHVK